MARLNAQNPGAKAVCVARVAGAALSDFIYPRRCAGCRRRGSWVCDECLLLVSMFQAPLCDGCGVPLARARCHCDERGPGLNAVRSLGPFDGWLREAILRFKYEDEWGRVDQFGSDLAGIVAKLSSVEGLVPVPLHRSRLRSRGYNQSALLAEAVSRELGLPVISAIERTRATSQQARLNGSERARNVEGAFSLVPGIVPAGMHLALIDDVITTGSTINACASVLSDSGAASVSAVTLARQL